MPRYIIKTKKANRYSSDETETYHLTLSTEKVSEVAQKIENLYDEDSDWYIYSIEREE